MKTSRMRATKEYEVLVSRLRGQSYEEHTVLVNAHSESAAINRVVKGRTTVRAEVLATREIE